MTLKILAILLAFSTTLSVSAVELEFVPYNPGTEEAKARTNAIKDISKSLNSDEKKQLASLKIEYTKLLTDEKAKNTPVESRPEIKRIKTEYFTSMIEALRPKTVAKIMTNKRVLTKNKTLNNSGDKIEELFLKAKRVKKNDN